MGIPGGPLLENLKLREVVPKACFLTSSLIITSIAIKFSAHPRSAVLETLGAGPADHALTCPSEDSDGLKLENQELQHLKGPRTGSHQQLQVP